MYIVGSSGDAASSNGEGQQVKVKRAKRGHPRTTEWKREANKRRRMKGESYTGFAKSDSGLYKQSLSKEPRRLGPPCCCKKGKQGKVLKCSEFSEDVRSEVFRTFWSEMNWDQRKVFVASNVDKVMKQRTRTEEDTSRRGHSYVYHLKNGEIRKRVCKEMFLSTLCLGE